VLGATAAVGGWGYTAFSLTMAVGRFAGDGLVQRLGPVRVIQGGGALVALGMGVVLLVGTVPATLAGLRLRRGGAGRGLPSPPLGGRAHTGVPTGTAIAAVATAGYTGFLVGPPAIGLVSEAFGRVAGRAGGGGAGGGRSGAAGRAGAAGRGRAACGTTPVAEAAADL
jgi:MFS family permease